jgi:malate synthase
MGDDAPRVCASGLQVDKGLYEFVAGHVLSGLEIEEEQVWSGLAELASSVSPRIARALATRDSLQAQIDAWHQLDPGQARDAAAYRAFLNEIGYIVPVGEDFTIETSNVDAEISHIAGPQLVVPVSNARFALNAANARWGSLYDAVYGTDVLGSRPPDGPYDASRGAEVVAWVRKFLDETFPLVDGSHVDARGYEIVDGALQVALPACRTRLSDPGCLSAYLGDGAAPQAILLDHNSLGVIIEVDHDHPVGRNDAAGLKDVVIESAVTTIIDFEDSVAAVDVADKVAAYSNWLGLMRGDLTAVVDKGDHRFERRLKSNRSFTALAGEEVERRGRSLLLVRNVGNLMTTDAVLDREGVGIPETLLDAMLTVLIALHDFARPAATRNSPAGSIYVVKPKLHGPDEVALTDEMFSIVERSLGLPLNTVKIGVMDEERRTTVNLKECIRAARERIAFINTGFLDRTGDEIHTSMEAGSVVRRADMRATAWIQAYEDWNVDTGLACGFRGRAQIGKGMWAAPDEMAQMLDQKIAHPQAGANTAWVPSPTAATLHATHYHRVDVGARQEELSASAPRATLSELLTLPLADASSWSADERRAEVDNNVQGILGYVVRWVDQGIGCSKVPDVNNVALMEDRATCRISAQHVANWLHHDVVTADEVEASLRRMAIVVDQQNVGDPLYTPMAPAYDGEAFLAARALILEGTSQPSGYTEPILHSHRARQKARTLIANGERSPTS